MMQMSFFGTMNISATGLSVQRARMDVHAQNLANVDTTRTPDGGPYRRRAVVVEERGRLTGGMGGNSSFAAIFNNALGRRSSGGGGGVRVHSIREDDTVGPRIYDPGHPDADASGYVERPNVNVVAEMVNMISATRSYEANITAMQSVQSMMQRTLDISGR
jgi:flagellar basal-body rod protein FlgC